MDRGWLLCLVAVSTFGCSGKTSVPSPPTKNQVANSQYPPRPSNKRSVPKASILGGYRCAPSVVDAWHGPFMVLHDEELVIAREQSVLLIKLAEETYIQPRIEELNFDLHWRRFSWVKDHANGTLALGELDGSGPVRTLVFEDGVLTQILPLLNDTSSAQFSEDGKVLTQISYNTLMVSDLEKGVSTTRNFGEEWSWDMEFVPGTYGRLILVSPEAEDEGLPAPAPYWLDSAKGRRLEASEMPPPKPGCQYFVDQGYLLCDDGKAVSPHGRYSAVSAVFAGEDPGRFSPWRLERSADRKTLRVRSIYRAGPEFELIGGVFGQEFFALGRHAAVCTKTSEHAAAKEIAVYDLRDGKIGATLRFGEGTDTLILTRDAAIGSKAMLAKHNIPAASVNMARVRSALLDLISAPVEETGPSEGN